MKSQIKKMIIFLSAVMMLTVVMCLGVSAESATCPVNFNGQHSWMCFDSKTATCEEDGYDKYRCFYCREEKTEIKSALGGACNFVYQYTQDCSAYYECSKDDCFASKLVVVNPDSHGWDGGQYDYVEPTCENDGSYGEYCMICQEYRTITVPARGYHEWVMESGTCGDFLKYYCEYCGERKTENNPNPTGDHDWEWDDSKEPTCTEDGWVKYFCERDCGTTKREEYPATGHSIDSWEIKYATCTEEGLMGYGCLYCSEADYTEIIPATGHTYLNDWSEILSPSCTGQGVKIKVCNDCSYVAHETIDALGHTDTEADEICDTCSLALSEKADTDDKAEEEKPAEAPDEAPEENPGSNGSESVDTSVTVINRILAFFERIMEFFESLFDFVR